MLYVMVVTILTGRTSMPKFTQVYSVIEFGEIILAKITHTVCLQTMLGYSASSIFSSTSVLEP